MKQSDSYDRSIHRTGRLGSILAIAWMLGIPAVMCTVYHMFPSIPDLLLFGSGLLALYVPTAISEVITYVPMLGSASYITCHQGQAQGRRPPRRAGLSDPRVRHTSQPRHRHPGLHPPVHPVRLGAVPDGADPGGPSSPGWGPVTGKESTSYELSSERSGAV